MIKDIEISIFLINYNLNIMLPYIDYRNAKYQGPSRNFLPEGTGILLDDTLSLAISIWKAGQANGPTLIFYSHSKYIYG